MDFTIGVGFSSFLVFCYFFSSKKYSGDKWHRMAPEESQMQSTTKGLHNVAFCYFLSFDFLIRETLLYSEQPSARTNIEAE